MCYVNPGSDVGTTELVGRGGGWGEGGWEKGGRRGGGGGEEGRGDFQRG